MMQLHLPNLGRGVTLEKFLKYAIKTGMATVLGISVKVTSGLHNQSLEDLPH